MLIIIFEILYEHIQFRYIFYSMSIIHIVFLVIIYNVVARDNIFNAYNSYFIS
jgi:hypothetical protein